MHYTTSRARISPAVALAALAIFSAPARGDDAAQTYRLKRVYTVGAVDNYRLEFKGNVASPAIGPDPIDVAFTINMRETTRSVKPDGQATLNVDPTQAYIKFGPQEMDATALIPKSTQVRDAQGHVVSIKLDKTEGPAEQLGQLIEGVARLAAPFYPTGPVKIGDSWPLESIGGPATGVTGTARILGLEDVGALHTLKLKFNVNATDPVDKSGVKFDGLANVDRVSGQVVRLVGSLDRGGLPKPTHFDVSIRLIRAGEKTAAPTKK